MPTMRQYLFLINPISGTGNKMLLQEEVQSFCKRNNTICRMEPTNAKGEYAYLEQRILQEGITAIIIAGGDGTVNQVIGALRHCAVSFGILPLGSGNGLAYCAGIPVHLKKALKMLEVGRPQRIDAFCVNGLFACMLSGVGMDAAIAHSFAKQHKRGLMSYIKQSIKGYLNTGAPTFVIEVKGVQLSVNAYFISVANSNQFGNRVTIAPFANLQDGLLDIIIIKKMSKWILPIAVFSQIAGRFKLRTIENLSKPGNVIYFQASSLVIKNPSKALLHIDGEPSNTALELKINILPGAFNLIVP